MNRTKCNQRMIPPVDAHSRAMTRGNKCSMPAINARDSRKPINRFQLLPPHASQHSQSCPQTTTRSSFDLEAACESTPGQPDSWPPVFSKQATFLYRSSAQKSSRFHNPLRTSSRSAHPTKSAQTHYANLPAFTWAPPTTKSRRILSTLRALVVASYKA